MINYRLNFLPRLWAFGLLLLISPFITNQAYAQTDYVNNWGVNNSEGGSLETGFNKSPTKIPGLSEVVSIIASNSSSYALVCAGGKASRSSDGTLWAWGSGSFDQIGNGTDNKNYMQPIMVDPGVDMVSTTATTFIDHHD